MRDNPKPFEVYKHFKGNNYQILAVAKDSEDGHLIVVYQALYGSYEVYARDLTQFMSPVDHIKYPDVKEQYRFTRIAPTSEMGNRGGFSVDGGAPSDKYGVEKNSRIIVENASGNDCGELDKPIKGISGTTEELIREKRGTTGEPLREKSGTIVEPISRSNIEEVAETISAKNSEPEVSSYQMDPMVEAFLDADTYEEKINILAGLKNRITDEMLQIMAVTMDIELNSENTYERYKELMGCLSIKEKFEVERRF